MLKLENKRIIIATHVYTTGPAQDLREYLLNKGIEKLLFIGHPLFWDEKLSGSGFEVYEKGKLKEERYKKNKKNPALFVHLVDIWLNIFWTFKKMSKGDLYVGCNNLNAFSGIILRFFGRTKKVVYYVIDYNPKRFDNRFLNYFYHKLDHFCVKHVDEVWNLSLRMEEARKKYFKLASNNQQTAPIGIWFERFPRLDFSKIEKQTLVFMGHVLEKQGVQYVIEAIPIITKKMPNFKFLVIGGGEYLEALKKQATELKVEKFVDFSGFVKEHKDVEMMLSKCACAIAMYEKFDEKGDLSFTYFADPGKIKAYLAGGLPIIMSDVSHNAKEIVEKHCGFVVEQNKESIAGAVIELLQNEKVLKEYRKNATAYAEQFDWNVIFEKNLERIMKLP